MPLQNRVNPFGELVATPARGTMMGNRGGRFHRPDRTLRGRRWTSRHWICCDIHYKGARHEAMGEGYTSLFFLDEVTALAAGHRPCFECRREEATHFATLFGKGERARAAAMDKVLQAERLAGKLKRLHRRNVDSLPDGAMVAIGDEAFAVRGKKLLRWTPSGYCATRRRPRGRQVDVLTPPSIIAVFTRGYAPHWHRSAD
jgi:hypothetical protein